MKSDVYASARTKVQYDKKLGKWLLIDKELCFSLMSFKTPAEANSAKRSWWFYLTADHDTSMKHLGYLENAE